jgi:choline dehydrogenase-like flavoprotein
MQPLRFDDVVLGAGSAGCVLAARLSEDAGRRVALVEAGGDAGRSLLVRMPAANGLVFGNPRFDWGFRTEPQAHLDGRTLYWPRGLGLGGSSLIHGMVYVRGNPRDYDGWRDRGLAGWGHADVLPYFKRAEGSFRPPIATTAGTGRCGPAPPATSAGSTSCSWRRRGRWACRSTRTSTASARSAPAGST